MEELTARGFPLMVTARDAFQVCELADKKGLSYTKIGRHHGKNRALKAAGLLFRALQLSPVEFRERPVLAVSHGARSQILLSNLLRIPTILIEDYEHSQFPRIMRPTWIMSPDVIPDEFCMSQKWPYSKVFRNQRRRLRLETCSGSECLGRTWNQ